ncbi:MAG: prephenate dehydratase domain-containing protein, partial [Rhodothermales bacterium]|nr:prephenate dehydratase domain-containing protein [Rhodothermales bacterium]
MTVAYPGLPGSATMEAARAVAGGGELVPEPAPERVLEAVAAGEVERGVLPVESTDDAGVAAALDLLFLFEGVHVVGERWSRPSRQDHTRFFVVAREAAEAEGADCTALLLVPNRAVPNALFRSLTAFVGRRLT